MGLKSEDQRAGVWSCCRHGLVYKARLFLRYVSVIRYTRVFKVVEVLRVGPVLLRALKGMLGVVCIVINIWVIWLFRVIGL
jgi:hypothetical protein